MMRCTWSVLAILVVVPQGFCVLGRTPEQRWLTMSRGGETVDTHERMEAVISQHEAICESSVYWSGESGDSTQALDLTFDSFGVPGYTLPDFMEQFDNRKMIFVSKEPMFTKEECKRVVDAAERFFAEKRGGAWTTLPSGRFSVSGFWVKDVPEVAAWFNEMVKTRLFPGLASLFPALVEDMRHLVVESAYLFKYAPDTGERSDTHTDSGCLSFTISLNPQEEYDGGGTWFEGLERPPDHGAFHAGENGGEPATDGGTTTGRVVAMDVGQVTFRPGGVRHQGHAIRGGVRYVIGGFVVHRLKAEPVRLLLSEGTALIHAGRHADAAAALRLAARLNPHFDGTHTLLASAQRRLGDDAGAAASLETALRLNPRNGEAAYSLGLVRMGAAPAGGGGGGGGNTTGAARGFERALVADPQDSEALTQLAALRGAAGDVEAEAALLTRALAFERRLSPGAAGSAWCNLGVALGELRGRGGGGGGGRGGAEEDDEEDEEVACYRRCLAHVPGNFQASFSLASALANRGDLDGAVAWFRKVADSFETNGAAGGGGGGGGGGGRSTDGETENAEDKAEQRARTLRALYKAAAMVLQRDQAAAAATVGPQHDEGGGGGPGSRDVLIAKLEGLMGPANYRALAQLSRGG